MKKARILIAGILGIIAVIGTVIGRLLIKKSKK